MSRKLDKWIAEHVMRTMGGPNMKVIMRTQQASEPIVFDDILNAYTKDGLYCMRMRDGSVLKFPLVHIFTIREIGAYIANDNKPAEKPAE